MIVNYICVSAVLLLLTGRLCAAPYIPLNESCDGLPKLPIGTQDNICIGLLAQRSDTIPLKIPRTAVQTPEGKFLVVDLGAWMPNKGKLWLLDLQGKTPKAHALLSNLNFPHKILRAADGSYFIGEAQRISQFNLSGDTVTQFKTVLDNLPAGEGYLHPLKNFVFDRQNNLIVNIGSKSDNCALDAKACTDGSQAGLWRFNYQVQAAKWDTNHEIIARGLRNSMVLAVHTSGNLLQAENSLDFPDAQEPYEEINIIEEPAFYGWPQCFNRKATQVSSDKECSSADYREPWSLMPPHVAPLDAIYYAHSKLPGLSNKLIMSWHGYKVVGHRIVAFDIDERGRPLLSPQAEFKSDPLKAGEPFKTQTFNAKGGTGLVAQHHEIINRWNALPGIRPKGAPVGLSIMNDGSLLIVDDKNAALLRVSSGTAYIEGAANKDGSTSHQSAIKVEKSISAAPAPTELTAILQTRCGHCHEQLLSEPGQLLNAGHWLEENNGQTRLEYKVFVDAVKPMPPDGALTDAERRQIKLWLTGLKTFLNK